MKQVRVFAACVVVLVCCGVGFAYTVATGAVRFVQPNGVTFLGRQWTDGYVPNSLTSDGYAFVQSRDGYYYYAELNERGELTATQVKVGIDDPASNGIRKGIHRTAESDSSIQEALERSAGNLGRTGKPAAIQAAPPDSVTYGIVLVEFNDVKGSSYTESDFEDMFFDSNYTGTSHPDGQTVYGSIAAYWNQMSGGAVTITADAVQGGPTGGILNPVYSGAPSWVPLSGNKVSYHTSYTMAQFRSAARAAAANMGINTTTSSTYRIAYIYAGNLYDQFYWAGCVPYCGLIPNAAMYGGEFLFSELRDTDHDTNARNCEGGGCAGLPCFPHIGQHVHEMGHNFGLHHPHEGTYSVASDTSYSDVHMWSVMQGGDQAGGDIASSPMALTPEEMKILGFASFTSLSGRRDDLTVNAGTYYQIDYGPGRFVVEHRNGGGAFNNYLWKDAWNGSGVLLWFTYTDGAYTDDAEQCLVAADGDPNNIHNMFGDMFPGSESVTAINDDNNCLSIHLICRRPWS